MNEIEAIEVLKNMDIGISGKAKCKKCIFSDEERCFRDGKDCQMIAMETVLNLLEKKDKIIDLMAEQLTTPVHSKEWVIEHFNQKIEKGE